ncbi:hypothetical protein [Plantactinospora alkalitolerans]|uniref:hypothetical protein n=1 Tax=Plantactinospora alkalitolerans TaxID=2789879 RepID=UPI002B1F98DA|nr:hypothetical protein [Plantactinospora alkalitolerans]
MSRRKETSAAIDAALRDGWSSACRLYEHLVRGGQLVALPPTGLRLGQDEKIFGDTMLGYARFYGTSAQYRESSSFWFGSTGFVLAGMASDAISNASARSRAQAMAAAQWRDQAQVRMVLTNQRLLGDYQGNLLSFWHNGVQELAADLSQWSFVLRYQEGNPLMLHGPAAPWYAVAIAWQIFGPEGMRLPALAPITAAVAQRTRAITGEIVPDARS